jgi:arsenate reductase
VQAIDEWRGEAEALREAAPRHVLFLCVANSARSQMAEAIARSLAPAGVLVSSAGSAPTAVRPEALAVLAELGLDAAGQRSKGVEDVERPVDAVITLCAEEVCPVGLAGARRLHWPIPDPAGAGESLDGFRAARDEILRRLIALAATMLPDGVTLGVEARPEGEFVVARRGGEVVGAAGLERHGGAAILRGVEVAPALRGAGLGVALTAHRLVAAHGDGVEVVYLLTTTAPTFFLRFGFRPFPREGVPTSIAGSEQFASLCPASALCMAAEV